MHTRRKSGVGGLLVGLLTSGLVLAGAAVPVHAAPLPTAPAPAVGKRVGNWSVQRLSGDTWRISWRSPRTLPITSDRPAIVRDGATLGVPVVHDGRVVTTVVRSASAPDPAELDVVLSGDRVSRTGRDSQPPTASSTGSVLSPADLLDFDPAEPGPYQVVSSDYRGEPVPIEGFTEPVEFVGHVVEPGRGETTGPRGVVLFLHGRHSYCYADDDETDVWQWPCAAPAKEIPSHLGYDYVQQRLASQGYFTVSIRVNGINAQDGVLGDGGAAARAKLVRAHLDYWAGRAADHDLDLAKVVLVGHSRGGEGVARAALQIPLSAPYRVVGQVLLAPTDFSAQAVPYVPTVTVLPYCDGDVFDLQGQRYTDAARDVVSDDSSLHASVLVWGANHNYFNTEWTPGSSAAPSWDDWWGEEDAVCGASDPQRLAPEQQQSVGIAYVAAAVQVFTGTDQRPAVMLDGPRVRVASTGSAVVLSHAVGGGRSVRAPARSTGTTDATMDASFCRGVTEEGGGHSICGRGSSMVDLSPHWATKGELYPERKALELAWDGAGQVGGLLFDKTLNLSGRTLQLRTIVDPGRGPAAVTLRLTDADGASAELDPVGGRTLAAFDRTEAGSRLWAQAVTVDPTGAGIDLSRVRSVELVSSSARGRVWLLDVAAVSPTLPSVPTRRVPLVSLGTSTVAEGNNPEARTVKVPFTISQPVVSRSSLVVRVAAYGDDQPSDRITLSLAPGQTTGTIPVDVVGNTSPTLGTTSGFGLTAWAASGVMTDAYLGTLEIQEDEPPPTITLTASRKTVKEGQSAVWVLTTSEPLANDVWFDVTVVRGPKGVPALTGADVSRTWREQHAVSARKAIYRQGVWIPVGLKAGRTTQKLSIPITSDKKKEGREQLTLEVSLYDSGLKLTRTVYVAASRKG